MGELMYLPPGPWLKLVQVMMALPWPQAAM